MKKSLTFCFLLFSMMFYAQQLTLTDVSPSVEKPKKLQGHQIKLKAVTEDKFLCSSWNPYGLFLADKDLNILHTFEMPSEYKKYVYEYLCSLKGHHFVYIYKGFKNQLLGLLDENLKLVKTFPLAAVYGVKPLAIYQDDNYVYLNIYVQRDDVEYVFVRMDENMNVITEKSSALFAKWEGIAAWEKDDVLYVRKGNCIILRNKETLEKISVISLWDPKNDDPMKKPNNHQLIYGENAFVEQEITYEWNEVGYIRVYGARLADYNNKTISFFTIKSAETKEEGLEHINDAALSDDEQLVVARVTRKWRKEGKEKRYEKPRLTLYKINKDNIQNFEFGEMEEDNSFPLFFLECKEDKAYLLVGSGFGYRILVADMQNKTMTTILSKRCDFDFSNSKLSTVCNKWQNQSGYCLEFSQRKGISRIMDNQGAYIDLENTFLFVDKNFKYSEAYRSKTYTGMNTYYMNSVISTQADNYTLIKHNEPHYSAASKSFYDYDLHYWLIDNKGHRQIMDLGNMPQIVAVSPTEYYILDSSAPKTYQLKKLTVQP